MGFYSADEWLFKMRVDVDMCMSTPMEIPNMSALILMANSFLAKAKGRRSAIAFSTLLMSVKKWQSFQVGCQLRAIRVLD